MNTAQSEWDIDSETSRLARVRGWFQLATEARERGDLDEMRACEKFASEDCTDEELRKYREGALT
jgi:hypothetical protein